MQNVFNKFKMELVEVWRVMGRLCTQISNNLISHSFKDVFLSQADFFHRAAEADKLLFIEAFKILAEATNEAVENVIWCIARISVDSEQVTKFLWCLGRVLLNCLDVLSVECFQDSSDDRMLAKIGCRSVLGSVIELFKNDLRSLVEVQGVYYFLAQLDNLLILLFEDRIVYGS